jgi:Holliday junction DNA helicase RuvA
MIASLSGIVKSIRPNSLVIDVGGVGLLVFVSPNMSAEQVVGTSISLHTSLAVREDALTLYGFETSEARDLFELLQTVTGIGPKVAQSALAIFSVPELVSTIASESAISLEKIPGLGKKGSQRLILELKEKISEFSHAPHQPQSPGGSAHWRDQVTAALLGLGFTARETADRIDATVAQLGDQKDLSIEEILRIALTSGKSK